jgi:hypothetical protein
VARALDVPLYRRVIVGSAVEQGAEYGARCKIAQQARGVQGDETEDLYELLASVMVLFLKTTCILYVHTPRDVDSSPRCTRCFGGSDFVKLSAC